MKFLYLLSFALFAIIARADAIVVEVDSVTCSTISLKINATAQQFTSMPQDLQVTVNNQIHSAPFPSTTSLPPYGSELQLQTTLQFDSAFIFPDGYYNMTLNLVTSDTTNYSVATDYIDRIYFSGCSASATATSSPAVTSINMNSYYSAVGVPTHGISTMPQGFNSNEDSGLSSGAKIGITVGVLGVALLAVLGTMALLYRRWKHKETLSTGSKVTRYVDGKWINEDRNSAELKEIHQNQV